MILNLVHVRHDWLVGKTCLLDLQVGPSLIQFHFVEFELEWHGLEAPPSC